MNDKIQRLLKALDSIPDTKGRGRVKEIADKTGYSEGMVSRILAGKVDASEKFMVAICKTYFINRNWLETGEGSIFLPRMYIGNVDPDQLRRITSVISGEDVNNNGAGSIEIGMKVDVNQEFTKFTDSVNEARNKNIAYLQGLVAGLNNDEFKPVEEFIFKLLKQRK